VKTSGMGECTLLASNVSVKKEKTEKTSFVLKKENYLTILKLKRGKNHE
jgi:hypothetical protein